MTTAEEYSEAKKAYLKAAHCMFEAFDELENAIDYFKKAEHELAPYDERIMLLESIREIRKEVEAQEETVNSLYNLLSGRTTVIEL